jgi:hypothetical protein
MDHTYCEMKLYRLRLSRLHSKGTYISNSPFRSGYSEMILAFSNFLGSAATRSCRSWIRRSCSRAESSLVRSGRVEYRVRET